MVQKIIINRRKKKEFLLNAKIKLGKMLEKCPKVLENAQKSTTGSNMK